ncbi:AEC family transporter [Mesobacterium sp. TK19101]|uniref:AEC family transporter n=1 Tax=Mesobacterium hydrothermale TaxID=3111907 RepID=A0ABU6HDR1_9RHOB|nr:AEC family transporter [Mesobacterium sp. TK19101]MEC3860598.1 AEC family transporter [Mesobacterium sp. TK19101]
MQMLHVLTHNILPVFSMLALGFVLGRTRKVSRTEAAALNRVAFLVLQPALIFPLIARVDFHAFDLSALAAYATCQVIAFSLSYGIARHVFGREHLEAWLLAMCVIFVNSLLYIWPISLLIYGAGGNLPITAIVAWDASVSFAFFIITTDVMAGDSNARAAVKRVLTNPVLIAIALGTVMNLAALPVPEPVLTAARFAGAGAAPLTLFALGVILSGHALKPSPTILGISGLKLLLFPALVWAALHVAPPPADWNALFVLNAAGPSGAMAFALAMLHGIRTDAIAPVIIWTSTLSLISLAWLA